MSTLSRREFLQIMAAAGACGMPLAARAALEGEGAQLYAAPAIGNVHFLHFTDCHAQLLPLHYREADCNLGIGAAGGQMPHLVGEHLLKWAGLAPGSRSAHAFSHLDFMAAAKRYGKVGGFAHLATLVKRLRAARPQALLLDGGDTWQGSATALWTRGADMVQACQALGVDIMTPHWEMTLGQARVQELVAQMKGKTAFLAQNIHTQDFGDPVFEAFTLREMNGVPVAVIGQAFPYTPIANPRHLVADWRFGIEEENLQKTIAAARAKGAQVVVLLSHNGMDVDLKLASRVSGLDAILGGHTHDAVPQPVLVKNSGGQTLVTNAGSHGKFLGVLDFEVKQGKIVRHAYRLLPVFADLLPPDAAMQELINKLRAPYLPQLQQVLAHTEGGLYRRGNFNGSFDQLLLDALLATQEAQIAFSPGFRWGGSLLPGAAISFEDVMAQTATTYSQVTVNQMTGAEIKAVLEDVADNLFNPDPYYQQGGDMVRVGGLQYTIAPLAKMGQRINDMRLDDKPLQADKRYKVASWASVQPGQTGPQVWDVVAGWLRSKKTIPARTPQQPRILGMQNNPGWLGQG